MFYYLEMRYFFRKVRFVLSFCDYLQSTEMSDLILFGKSAASRSQYTFSLEISINGVRMYLLNEEPVGTILE